MNEPGPSSKADDDPKDENFKRTGSFRKILPGTSDGKSQLHTSIKMIDRPNMAQSNAEFSIYLQEYSILSEYKLMQQADLRGIYVIPSAQNPYLWFGVLFIRQGAYQGAVFRFTITLPDAFPDSGSPKVVFQTKVFHPLVNKETGEFKISAGFPEWKKSNRIFQLVQFIAKVFNELDPDATPANEEAGNLLKNDYREFYNKANRCVREALDHVFDPPDTEDAHYITFSNWDRAIHEPIRREIFSELYDFDTEPDDKKDTNDDQDEGAESAEYTESKKNRASKENKSSGAESKGKDEQAKEEEETDDDGEQKNYVKLILEEAEKNKPKGYSFVEPGTFKPLSKPPFPS